jgi:hypothetical protein
MQVDGRYNLIDSNGFYTSGAFGLAYYKGPSATSTGYNTVNWNDYVHNNAGATCAWWDSDRTRCYRTPVKDW